MSQAIRTTDHREIKRWIEEREGAPAQVRGTGGLLRIDFGEPDESLEKLDWDDFFKKFDENEIVFLCDPDENSRFNKFIRK